MFFEIDEIAADADRERAARRVLTDEDMTH
jgi:hypothetical protein